MPREGRAEAAETADHLVEDQEDAVPVADLPQPLEIALRRQDHPGGAGERLHDHRRDRVGAVQLDDPLQIVGQYAPPFSGTPRVNALCSRSWVWRMWSTPASSGAEELAVVDDAAPTEMPAGNRRRGIALFPADQPGPAPPSPRTLW